MAEDIRYTQSKDGQTLYAIALGLPKDSLTLTAVKVNQAGPNAIVSMLGGQGLQYSVNARKQLVIDVPAMSRATAPCKYAYSFKLTGFDLDIQADAVMEAPKTEMVHD